MSRSRQSGEGNVTVRIGELSRRTGVPTRLLRYYEEQELLFPDREANGYRSFPDSAVSMVGHIKGLIEAGVPTRIIRSLLPCLEGLDSLECLTFTGVKRDQLVAERDSLDRRIAQLIQSRDAITTYLERSTPEPIAERVA